MIDRDAAKSLVLRYLSIRPCLHGSRWVVVDDETQEFDIAWMFCWTLERLTRSGAQGSGMVGNYPILVDKRDGSLYAWTMLEPLERVLEKLRHDQGSLPRLDIDGG
jgi:hypothetical protein